MAPLYERPGAADRSGGFGAALVGRARAQTSRSNGPDAHVAILELQRRAGNRAVAQLLHAVRGTPSVQRVLPGETPIPDHVPALAGRPSGSVGDRPALDPGAEGPAVELLQQKLNFHFGFMALPLMDVDGRFGAQTGNGVLAFKQEAGVATRTRRVDAETWTALDAPPSRSRTDAAAGPAPDSSRMFEDGLLEITIAIGFDEHGLTPSESRQVLEGLTNVRGWTIDPAGAASLLAEARRPGPAGAGTWLVKSRIGVSEGRPVHGVLRLVVPDAEESGARTRAAALEGMDRSDAFIYSGHGRFGTGPDFDRNVRFAVNWTRVSPRPGGRPDREEFTEYASVARALHVPTSTDESPRQLRRLRAAGIVEVIPITAGNVGINSQVPEGHTETVGSDLQNAAASEQGNALRGAIRERHYRMWFFDGCTTRDYEQAIRLEGIENDRLADDNLAMTTLSSRGSALRIGEAALTYLDGLIAGESALALQHRTEEAHRTRQSDIAAHSSGFRQ